MQETPDHREALVLWAPLVRLVTLVWQALKVSLAALVNRDLGAYLVLLDSLALLDLRVTRAKSVHRVTLAVQVQLDRKVDLVLQDHEEIKAKLDLLDLLVHLVQLVLLDSRDHRVREEIMVIQVILELLDL